MDNNNLSILRSLRDKPLLGGQTWQERLRQVDSLLDQHTLNTSLQRIRWPKGISCPRCHSTRIRLLTDRALGENELPHYQCIPCEHNGFQSIFTALTDLPEEWIFHLRQLLMCWFMQRVCSISQLAHKFGLSPVLLKQFMQWYEQQLEATEDLDLDESDNPLHHKAALAKQGSIDGHLTKKEGGRFTVSRDGFAWDGEEVRVLKERRFKHRR